MKTLPFGFSKNALTINLLLFISFSLMVSCASTQNATQITGTWKDPETTLHYKDFFVAVLTRNLTSRTALEDNIAGRLKQEGVKAAESREIFPNTEKVETAEEKKAAVEKIQSLGHDAIITIVLVSKKEEELYRAGNTSYAPNNVGVGSGYYNPARQGTASFNTYYTGASTLYSTPGTTEINTLYYLQSNLYDANTSKLVWSAKSETFNPGNINSASRDFASLIVDALKNANLIELVEKGKK